MVDDCNIDERLESSWRLVYYQVSGEPGITGCSRWSDIYLVGYGLARKVIHWLSPHNFIFRVFNFFAVDLYCKIIILTAKFSRSTVYTIYGLIFYWSKSWDGRISCTTCTCWCKTAKPVWKWWQGESFRCSHDQTGKAIIDHVLKIFSIRIR